MRGRKWCDEKGQAAVEFAVVLPLLATMLLALVQGAITLNHYLTLTDAVRAGARAASAAAANGPAAATAAASQAITDAADGLELTGAPTVTSSTWSPGDPVTVSASVPYSISILGVTVASGTFTSRTTQRAE